MNIPKSLVALLFGALVSGCAAQPTTIGPYTQCPENPHTQVTVHFKKNNEIRVTGPGTNPNAVPEVQQGRALRFRLLGDAGTQVTIFGKDAGAAWLWGVGTATGGGNTYITVCVDQNQPEGTYGYNVRVKGVGELDPLVRVVGGN